jgi:hypothetical protein
VVADVNVATTAAVVAVAAVVANPAPTQSKSRTSVPATGRSFPFDHFDRN